MPPPPTPPPPTEAPGLTESIEASLRVLLRPAAVFEELVKRPVPGYLEMLLNFVLWTGFGALLASLTTLNQVSGALGSLGMLLVPLAGLILGVPVSFAGAGVLHVLSMLSGGQGGFRRTYQIVSLLGAMAPVSAVIVALPVPYAWIAPTLLITYLAVIAVDKMHDAPAGQAWLVLGAVGALIAGGQFMLHRKLVALRYQLETLATLYSTRTGESPMMAPSGGAVPLLPIPGAGGRWDQRADRMPGAFPGGRGGSPYGRGGYPPAQGGLPPSASLDMLRGRRGAPRPMRPGQGPSPEQLRQLMDMGRQMAAHAQEQFAKNPEALEQLPPEQRKMMKHLMSRISAYTSGEPTVEEDRDMAFEMLKFLRATGGKLDIKQPPGTPYAPGTAGRGTGPPPPRAGVPPRGQPQRPRQGLPPQQPAPPPQDP